MVVCPACGSSRIRHDYRPAPFYLRIFLIRALLCDYCNRQFRAFSLRMPGERQSNRPKRRADTFVSAPDRREGRIDLSAGRPSGGENRELLDQIVKRHRPAGGELPGGQAIDQPTRQVGETGPVVAGAPVGEGAARKGMDEAIPEPGLSIACPDCGSSRVKRRPRKPLERLAFSITDHRAYVCRECQRSFYARPGSA